MGKPGVELPRTHEAGHPAHRKSVAEKLNGRRCARHFEGHSAPADPPTAAHELPMITVSLFRITTTTEVALVVRNWLAEKATASPANASLRAYARPAVDGTSLACAETSCPPSVRTE